MFDKKIDNTSNSYGDDAIVTLSPREHIRLRPGMYIGKLGDGSQADDGIYVLIKEVVDNSVDEFIMGAGKQIDVTVEDDIVTVRDYGRGIPLKSLAAAVSEMNTGGKYGGSAFKKTVGLNGVGVRPFGARRRGPHGDFRAGARTERPLGERRAGEKRYVYQFPCGPGGVR